MLSILGHILFFIFLIASLIVLFLGLPGTFMILGATFLYALLTGFVKVTGGMLFLMLLVTLMGEVAEYFFGIIGAKRYGSSTKGIIFSLIGGFIGAIVGAPVLFGLGAIIGALCGAFAGAVVIELKTVEKLNEIHFAQLLTYLKLGNYRLGLLLNFKEKLLKNGIRRIIN